MAEISNLCDETKSMSLDKTNHIQLNPNSWVKIYSLPEKYKLNDFETLWKLCPKEHAIVNVFGKDHPVPRFMKAYGKDYNFSKTEHKSELIENDYLKQLQNYVNEIEYKYKGLYNGILVNWYRDGNDYIGPHSDSEVDLVSGAPIYSFSFGVTRDFVIKAKKGNQRIVLSLENNTVCTMGGEMQKDYTHTVPKRLRCKERRVNVTIRAFKEK
jgi:alkylated DNA repair dioxygenase AlkB